MGPIIISSYSFLLSIGLLLGAALVYLRAHRRRRSVLPMLDAALAAALGGLIVARMVYVAIHWTYYQTYIHRAWRLWNGGLTWQGALVGGMIGVLIHCTIRRCPLGATLDVLTPGVGILAMFTWLGCFMIGCAPGIETYPVQKWLWPLSLQLPDLYGIHAPRVPVQLLGAAWSALVLGAVLAAERRSWSKSLLFPLWLALYGAGSFALGYWRGDDMLLIKGWRLDQLLDLALTIGTGTLLVGLLAGKLTRRE